jgi:hypothetical protein
MKFIERVSFETRKYDESYHSSNEEIKNEQEELRKCVSKIKIKKNKNEDLSSIDSYRKGTKPHKSAVIGDTVGDHLKILLLNILIKLSAVVSLILGPYFPQHIFYLTF